MKRPVRNANGNYVVAGKTYKELFGSRAQVHNGTAYKTTGGLTKKDLVMNKWGRIVSEKKHKTAKREKRLQKFGYYTKKGKFGAVKRASSRKNKSRKGGADMSSAAAPYQSDPVDQQQKLTTVNKSVDKIDTGK